MVTEGIMKSFKGSVQWCNSIKKSMLIYLQQGSNPGKLWNEYISQGIGLGLVSMQGQAMDDYRGDLVAWLQFF